MAKTNTEVTNLLLNGRQASELFSLHPGFKLWVKKMGLLLVEKTEEEWEKFFKENKVL